MLFLAHICIAGVIRSAYKLEPALPALETDLLSGFALFVPSERRDLAVEQPPGHMAVVRRRPDLDADLRPRLIGFRKPLLCRVGVRLCFLLFCICSFFCFSPDVFIHLTLPYSTLGGCFRIYQTGKKKH